MTVTRLMGNALDLLGRRWTLRLVWELRRDTVSFSELRERTGISPSMLTTRLGELESEDILERDGARRYRLSGNGRELARILYELNRWAERAGVSSRDELA
jgi:DNA-binding HxlR family transcriptional regulator